MSKFRCSHFCKGRKRTQLTVHQFHELQDCRIILGTVLLFYACNILPVYVSVCHVFQFQAFLCAIFIWWKRIGSLCLIPGNILNKTILHILIKLKARRIFGKAHKTSLNLNRWTGNRYGCPTCSSSSTLLWSSLSTSAWAGVSEGVSGWRFCLAREGRVRERKKPRGLC